MTEEEYQNHIDRTAKYITIANIKGVQASNVGKSRLPPSLRKLSVPMEDQEQNTLAQYLRLKGIRFHHSPNGGLRNVVVAKKLQLAGTSAGFPDIIIPSPPPNYPASPGVVIELKRQRGGIVSKAQLGWLIHFENHGWCCRVAKGAAEAIRFLQELGF